MSITASSLIALVEARGAKEASAQLLEVGAASETAGTKLKSLAVGGLLIAGAAAIGVGVASVKMAADFEQSTNLLITSAGEIPANIDLIRKGLLQMSVDTATPVDELTKGMFNVESASYHGAAGLLVEKAAAEGAKVENADLAKVTDVLTTSMHNYNLPASQAVDVMNSFRMAASIGKMRMDDLTGALRNVLPIASQAGVKLSDVEAALSTMSLAGDKGASAGTHLAQMLTYLLAPSSKATSALKEVGLTTQEISDEMKVSLPGTVQMITDAVGEKFPVGSAKYLAALSAIVGGNKSMKAMLELSGISLKTFTDDAKQLGPTMTANSTAVDGWNTVQSNFNFKMQAAKDAVDALLITLGTKLLPIVGKVADAVTPLITGFSDWITKSDGLSGAIDQVSSAFQQVFEPIKKVQDTAKPLLDTFDRATSIFTKTNTEAKPLMDTFDRGKSILSTTNAVAMPLFDTFDRATALLPKTTDVIKKTTEAVSPLVAIFKYWKPVIEDVFKDVETLAGDALTFGTGITDAAEKSGFFQSALQFLHDELPVVGTFLVNAGDAINQNLLPPLESLITNVGSAAAGFLDWADKSGVAKTTLDTLGSAVQLTTEILGPLIQAVSDVVGWLGGGGAGTDTLVFALSAAATAFTLLKIADTTAQFGSFISKLQEGDGIISNLASSVKDKLSKAFDDFMANQAPHLKASMDSVKTSAEEAAVAEEEVAAAPADTSAAGWFANLESSLGGVEGQAAATSASVAEVGTVAETTMAEGVAIGATESEASLAGVGVAADAAKTQVAGVGTQAETSAATGSSAMSGLSGGLVGLAISLALMASEWGYATLASKNFTDQFKSGDWLDGLKSIAALSTPGGQLAQIGNGLHQFGVEMGWVKDSSQDMSKNVSSNMQAMDKSTTATTQNMAANVLTSTNAMSKSVSNAAQTMYKDVVQDMTSMQKQSIAQGATLSSGLQNLFNTLSANANGTFGQMSNDAYDYLKNVEDYVNQAQENALAHQIGRNATNIISKNAYASGTDYAPGGPALVGEAGMELVIGPHAGYLPRGSKVIPNDQLMHGGSGWGGGGSNQPIHVHVHIADQEFEYLTSAMMDNATRQTRLRHARRQY